MFPRAALAFALLAAAMQAQQQRQPPPPYDPIPRLGILVPKLPADYALLLNELRAPTHIQDGPFDFQTGTLAGTPVVVIIQPAPGEVLRALGAITMLHNFNVRLLLYPGTSGGHLPKGEMAPGDVVLGAKNVDHGNYYLSPEGRIEPGEFAANLPGARYTGPLYANPDLLALLACSASRTASATVLPAWMTPVRPDSHPQVFFFGIQGSSTIWSDNKAYNDATTKVFHEIDEDGDWYSNLAGVLYRVPFLEVSVISNSINAFPAAPRGNPPHPPSEPDSHIVAQRLSNRILLDLIAHSGNRLLTGTFPSPVESPFPAANFETPLDPRNLLATCRK